ncbi:MAG: hypothetical protein MJ252_09930 [archaeon]|nr:hypothetical protein [archaeon]
MSSRKRAPKPKKTNQSKDKDDSLDEAIEEKGHYSDDEPDVSKEPDDGEDILEDMQK